MDIEENCENLMSVLVESRKIYGKACVDYEDKSILMKKKLLNLKLKTISNYNFKPKIPVPNIEVENIHPDIEDFALEIIEKQKRIDKLKQNLKITQEVVNQLKKDTFGKLLRKPLNAEAMLAEAKSKYKT